MLCQNCGIRPATIHFISYDGNEQQSEHLCEVCAAAAGHYHISPQAAFNKFFPGFFNFEQAKPVTEKTCPYCGLSFKELQQTGRPGCPKCYEVFHSSFAEILPRIQNETVHKGKIPLRGRADLLQIKEAEELKERLQKLVAAERFEEAALVRDKIRALESAAQAKGAHNNG
ncbi:MAG: UvrB/UvrC motif-containing protein [Clostridia bacterium]|nr:UvrB/UvrC motif-containing protein [Clostridia bacterium]MDD4798316.1 UvrB/UvrC motif-containing protein [Clostridia bacterium]